MAANTKPRKRYRPRVIDRDPVELAVNRATKLTPAAVDEVMGHYLGAFRAMREGVATEMQLCLLLTGVLVAKTIEAMGVVRGLRGHLDAAQAALDGIQARAMQHGTWSPTALYWQELDHLDSFLPLHRFQLEQVSIGELRQANQRVMNMVRGAGGRALQLRDLPAHEQLQLLGSE